MATNDGNGPHAKDPRAEGPDAKDPIDRLRMRRRIRPHVRAVLAHQNQVVHPRQSLTRRVLPARTRRTMSLFRAVSVSLSSIPHSAPVR